LAVVLSALLVTDVVSAAPITETSHLGYLCAGLTTDPHAPGGRANPAKIVLTDISDFVGAVVYVKISQKTKKIENTPPTIFLRNRIHFINCKSYYRPFRHNVRRSAHLINLDESFVFKYPLAASKEPLCFVVTEPGGRRAAIDQCDFCAWSMSTAKHDIAVLERDVGSKLPPARVLSVRDSGVSGVGRSDAGFGRPPSPAQREPEHDRAAKSDSRSKNDRVGLQSDKASLNASLSRAAGGGISCELLS
jgi:hypothetical protein